MTDETQPPGTSSRWKKGQSGNPLGKPKTTLKLKRDGKIVEVSLSELAREYTLKSLATMVSIMVDKENPAEVRLRAASMLHDRGWGKTPQAVELTGANGGPIEYANLTDEELDARIAAFVGLEPDSRTAH